LNYHYRSKNEELIDFSNHYFYDSKLQIVPNLVKGKKNTAIVRYKVNGKWINRKNDIEAKAVVEILKKLLKERKNKESIGIITFNSEQSYTIEDAIRKECKIDSEFAELILEEQNRFENNVDLSLFVKNLENVQGDERDIIILSVGYAPNEYGRIIANFGSLSAEGGENRLNVAITRAKERVYLVTSIEPEELNVDNTKNEGPKILKRYLSYTKAISNNNKKEARIWLNAKKEDIEEDFGDKDTLAKEIRESLIKNGYNVESKIGNTRNKIDLAIYDNNYNQYLIGIECINKDYHSMDEMIENQIYHQSFLQSRGWKIVRVWTRDWWLSKNKVINSIIKEVENAKKQLAKRKD
jgi:superfamily I DNA and/or RNA helicase